MNALARFVRTVRASRLFGKAQRLARRDRHRDALGLLDAALEVLPPDRAPSSLGAAAFSIRLSALMLRSRAAAAAGDVGLAAASIRAALPLLEEASPPASPRFRSFTEWEAWARPYLARAERGEAP